MPLNFSSISYPDSDFSDVGTAFENFINQLDPTFRQELGQHLMDLAAAQPSNGSPRTEFFAESLRWLGQSIVDGEFDQFNMDAPGVAAAVIEYGSDFVIGAAVGAAVSAAVFAFVPVGVLLPGSILAGYVAGTVLAIALPPVISKVGNALKGWIADGLSEYFGVDLRDILNEIYRDAGEFVFDNPLTNWWQKDPLVLDLDGDGLELVALADSNVHFDYGADGFAEKTGWVSPDDGFLVYDANRNGVVDGIAELFGSATVDGYAVLETLDSNNDGVIDAADDEWAQLTVWRDLDSDGVSDAGEMFALADLGISGFSLNVTEETGTNAGHELGFSGSFDWADGSTGTGTSVYFETEQANTQPDETGFTPAAGVELLPQLPRQGTLHSIAWVASNDAAFLQQWTDLTTNAPTMGYAELRDAFAEALLVWAGVENEALGSRGAYVDARHLGFVEAFFGDKYSEIDGDFVLGHTPGNAASGAQIEASFNEIVDVLLIVFLAQGAASNALLGTDIADVLASPHLPYSLLDFRDPANLPQGETPSDTPGNLGAVLQLIQAQAPSGFAQAVDYYAKALTALKGMTNIAFAGDAAAYAAFVDAQFGGISDTELRGIAIGLANGSALIGGVAGEGIAGTDADDTLMGNGGDDLLVGDHGSDIYVFGAGDGVDFILDRGGATDNDVLVLTGHAAPDASFTRKGDTLLINLPNSEKVIVDAFFEAFETEQFGIDSIRFADGTSMTRAQIAEATVSDGGEAAESISDSGMDDTIRGGAGDDTITISGGNDTLLWSKGDGSDYIKDTSGNSGEADVLRLVDVSPDDVRLSRADNHLLVEIVSTGETIFAESFFQSFGWDAWTFDRIEFEDGVTWDRQMIFDQSLLRGSAWNDHLQGTSFNDVFEGGAGNDFLQIHHGGHDTVLWTAGDGNDTVDPWRGSNDGSTTLDLGDLRPEDVRFSHQGQAFKITILATGEVLTIVNQFEDMTNLATDTQHVNRGLDEIRFANGVVFDRQDIIDKVGAEFGGLDLGSLGSGFFGGGGGQGGGGISYSVHVLADEFGNEFLTTQSGDFDDPNWAITNINVNPAHLPDLTANGFAGIISLINYTSSQTIYDFYGSQGRDYANGHDGNEVMFGFAGDDILDGGWGDDSLDGGAGNDILIGFEGADTLIGGAGSDTLDAGGGDDTLDGGAHNDTLSGGSGHDLLIGGAGNDQLNGYKGSDNYEYAAGDGHDVISENHDHGDFDILRLTDLNAADVELSKINDDLLIRTVSTAGSILIGGQFLWEGAGIERIEFADGSSWNYAEIFDNSWLRGTDGNETIGNWYSNYGDNTLEGKQGDDILYGAKGSDVYVYSSGDGTDVINESQQTSDTDALKFTDINAGDVELSRSGTTLIVSLLATSEHIFVNAHFQYPGFGIEEIRFADGTVYDMAAIDQYAWFRGTSVRDTINGRSQEDDVIVGGRGSDILIGDTGADTYLYKRGDGNDRIQEGYDGPLVVDRLVLEDILATEIRLARIGDSLVVEDMLTSQQITVELFFSGARGIESIEFSDGSVWNRADIEYWSSEGSSYYRGTTGDDTIFGSYLNQTLEGDLGNDLIDGSTGSDVIYGGEGNDTLVMSAANAGDVDTFDGGAGTDTANFASFGYSVHADLVTNNGFAETQWGPGPVVGSAVTIATLTFIENLTGSAFDDALFGDINNNELIGGAGNDVIAGRGGDDVIDGGAGNDLLTGDGGADMYRFNLGSFGTDVITDFEDGVDLLDFTGAGLSLQDFAVQQDLADTLLSYTDASNVTHTLRLEGFDQANLDSGDFVTV